MSFETNIEEIATQRTAKITYKEPAFDYLNLILLCFLIFLEVQSRKRIALTLTVATNLVEII